MSLSPPARPSGPLQRFALFALGFRPMYLLAALYAAVSVTVWSAQYAGWISSSAAIAGSMWHAHEMVFGYALAVIVGFLLTAGRNWTNQPTPSGAPLAAMAALWLAARVLGFTPWLAATAAFDVAFALFAAFAFARALWAARNQRNYFFVALLLVIAALNFAFYFALLAQWRIDLARVTRIALDLVLFIMVVMAGRVMPMFTQNALPGVPVHRSVRLDRASLGGVLGLIACDVAVAPGVLVALVALFAAGANGARLYFWRPFATRRNPLLWILHAAYAWIVLHLALRAASALGYVTPSLAIHALTVGAIGGLTLGMMTRTALGHTGRPLRAGAAETTMYVLVMLAALLRVAGPIAAPSLTVAWILLSALAWALAFLAYIVTYGPYLSRPRVDGRPG